MSKCIFSMKIVSVCLFKFRWKYISVNMPPNANTLPTNLFWTIMALSWGCHRNTSLNSYSTSNDNKYFQFFSCEVNVGMWFKQLQTHSVISVFYHQVLSLWQRPILFPNALFPIRLLQMDLCNWTHSTVSGESYNMEILQNWKQCKMAKSVDIKVGVNAKIMHIDNQILFGIVYKIYIWLL